MIQRKQTIWLLLATVVILLAFILPYGINKSETPTLLETMLSAKNNMILMVLTIITSVASFFAIFQYKNRKMQMKLSIIPMITSVAIIGFEIYNTYIVKAGNEMVIGLIGSTLFIGIFIPVFAISFLALAYNGIKSDEKLIRDTDRLR